MAARDAGKAPELRGRWRVREDTMAMAPPKGTKGPTLALRRVFVWSSTRTGAAQVARTKKLTRASGDLARLERGLGGRHYPNAQTVQQRVSAIASGRRVTAYLRTTIGTDPSTGKPTLSWHFEHDAVAAEATTDGWYALLTNLDPRVAAAAEVLRRYKSQEAVERRYSNFKGPLAVAPMFLKNNRAHRSPHHRHLPRAAHLLPHRKSNPPRHRPSTAPGRALRPTAPVAIRRRARRERFAACRSGASSMAGLSNAGAAATNSAS